MLRTICILLGTVSLSLAGQPAIEGFEMVGGTFSVTFTAANETDVRLEASPDLRVWTPVAILPAHLSAGSSMLSDPGSKSDSAKFYRLAAETASPKNRPNIVFIMTDDQAPWSTGASGNPHAITPAMDGLFTAGATFGNSFVTTPVCSPSRASLMTSRYGSELGITDWINSGPEPDLGLDPSLPTWPRMLQTSGYKNGLVGKWHLGSGDQHHPTRMGYDYFTGFRGGGTSPENPTLEKGGTNRAFSGYTPDILTDHAIDFLRESSDSPFALSLHFRAPHTAWLPVAPTIWSQFSALDPEIPNPGYPRLDTSRVKRMTREYLASVNSVDVNIERLLDELKTLNLTHRTIIVFTSDHGYNMGHNGIWHKGNGHWVLTENPPATANIPNGQRPNMYDHSLRVPTAVCWPGVIQPGRQVGETISNLDWFPTLLDLAAVDAPDSATIRGRSLLPLLLEKTPDDWNNDFFGEYSTHHQSQTHMRVYRTQRWKLIRDFLDSDRDELYDLENDPNEHVNLIHAESVEAQTAVTDLHEKIVSSMRNIGDPLVEIFDDHDAPMLIAARSNGTLKGAILEFSEPLESESAQDPGSYHINNSVSVTGAALLGDGRTVSLTTTQQTEGVIYQVNVTGVRDRSYNANVIIEASSAFSAEFSKTGGLLMEVYTGITGTSLSALRNASKFPGQPDQSVVVTEFEIPINASDNYGARLSGFIVPKVSGDYVFHLSSDDNGELWLSSDDNSSNLSLIAREPNWNRPRTWTGTERRSLLDAGTVFERRENVSRPIRLEADGRYLVEALVKDGQGGDNLAVTWRLASDPVPDDGSPPIRGEFLAPRIE